MIHVDARGLLCPQPLLRLREAARAQPAGSELELLVDDLHASIDVAVWCQRRGHQLLDERLSDGELTIRVRLA